jgi:hypothetical protein
MLFELLLVVERNWGMDRDGTVPLHPMLLLKMFHPLLEIIIKSIVRLAQVCNADVWFNVLLDMLPGFVLV